MDPLVVAAFAVVALLEIIVPLALGYWFVKQFDLSWRVFALGALFFIVVQVVHAPLVLVTQTPLYLALLPSGTTAALAALAIYLGLMAGLFEEVGRYLVYRYLFGRQKIPLTRENGLLFGTGWGGVESMIVALVVLSGMVSYLLLTGDGGGIPLPDDPLVRAEIEALRALTPLDLLPGLAERMMTITLHIAWSLMVLAAVVYGKKTLLVLAILWHAAVDAAAVYLAQTQGILVTEAVVFVFAVIGLVYIFWEWRRMGARAAS
ncbi:MULTISPECIES: YhfC family glutamic-type intramembrane protease [unclassified Methanoculleus]|uniref:YhfC family intramembrane metalloprotease n=1 Tax=unclassified Methanoculleus TaxID=2619537 RepID=UPI0025DAD2EC|nr:MULTISPECIES: YhfC family glutamic-type intramembrane protease [unclassified Methanoculleus]MCK9319125.1 YhfC family intramembrane metalloprotease [Methanoculleus sp.]MDD2254293.1 YhfC family glutamic-type intramembrane protease [Methanoculleus sp.]MDD2786803.1 YhfC family glutamic-type intramembrane protease [Methanoculleus sp.]MDD3216553.1 YhfC family glutamic-type intramembrane protease [Methanoculleus sp.]MDD4314403.1 YhfC family glutamic-type intramembrane protease [Methanoculleus sp.]